MTETQRTRVRRNAARGHYDIEQIRAVLDSNQICHVAFIAAGEPRIIPTLYMRRDDYLYLHGNREAALLQHLAAGGFVCVSVMTLDGVVVARSGFHCSMNYRSAIVFGHGEKIPPEDHEAVLEAFVATLVPGHETAVRRATPQELAATAVVRIPINEASAKIRSGPPIDDEDDIDANVWAGVIPFAPHVLAPEAAPDLADTVALPDYIRNYGPVR
ncbi:MAG: pyridoxamine 5'-phosphate oxidase family protein [Chloroflexi bacterium]|nr:MAG: pyridoxamine 5'-phosphate oxidase family protein [Chloroflexota bacterium]